MTTKLIVVTAKTSVASLCNRLNTLGLSRFTMSIVFDQVYNSDVTAILNVPDANVPEAWRKLGRDPSSCPTLHLMKA